MKKYDLRPGMGLAAPQLGINERFFVVCHEETEGKFKNYILINLKPNGSISNNLCFEKSNSKM